MGKKSKKKGGGGTNAKAARKEKLQERRGQQLEDLDRQDREVVGNKRPFFEGDRVWFGKEGLWGDGSNPNTYRGIVKRVHEDSLDIIPLQSKIDGNETSYRVSADDAFPDFCDLTLRFDVGDQVLCSGPNGWVPRTITYLWPIGEINIQGHPRPRGPEDFVPRYKCENLAAPEDSDYCIMKHPTSFRFDVGDSVVVDPKIAQATGKSSTQLRHIQSWLEGVVTSVDITGLDFYAVYKCSFDVAGKTYSCYILKDDDEHVARVDADPRGRLFESIEQDCSRYHFNYLVSEYRIDPAVFRDLIISKAIGYASYNALSWLQHDCGIDILNVKDKVGNHFLHMIASSSNATRFIKEAGRASSMYPRPDWELDLNTGLGLANMINNDGDTWLQVLVRRGHTRAFDAALSPHFGLAWNLARRGYFTDDNLARLSDSIKSSGDYIMQCIFDSFNSFRTLKNQCDEIHYGAMDSEYDLFQKDFMSVFQGDRASHQAHLLARFFLDWQRYSSLEMRMNPFTSIVAHGFFKLFSLLYDANDGLFLKEKYQVRSKEDKREYIQPKLCAAPEESSYEPIEVDIIMACLIGKDGPSYSTRVSMSEKNYYFQCIQQHALHCDPNDCPSLLSHLQGMEYYYNSDRCYDLDLREFWQNKIRILSDEESLVGRLQILNLLLQRNPNIKLNALEAVRHRQCGILRELVSKGLIRLESSASSNNMFTKHAAKLQFLEKHRIPPSMSTKCFLCYASVEYDDLQSLQYLCEAMEVPLELCDGWNLLHFSAFLGRIEIVAWLFTRPVWQNLVSEASRRKPYQNAYAVHIAASEGHIFLAELLLSMEVPAEDKIGRMPEQYAKKSPHQFVQNWAAEREMPSALERDIRKLLHLAKLTDAKKLKDFITTSKCLDFDTWRECDYSHHGVKGPMEYSFGDILRECCSTFPDQDFVFWICSRLYFCSQGCDDFFSRKESRDQATLFHDDLVSFATNEGYIDIVNYLSIRCFREIRYIVDPIERNSLLKTALTGSQLLLRIRAKILRICILVEIAQVSNKQIKVAIKQGGCPDELNTLVQVGAKVKKILVEEGYAESEYEYCSDQISWVVRAFDMSTCIYSMKYENHLRQQIPFLTRRGSDLSKVHIVLATEGFADLLGYCLQNVQGWTEEMELDIVRIAAFYGHTSIIDLFMHPRETDLNLLSSKHDRIEDMILGTGEACRCRDLIQLINIHGAPHDPIKEQFTPGIRVKVQGEAMRKSLILAVLNGYARELYNSDTDNKKDPRTLKVLVDKLSYKNEVILFVMEFLLSSEAHSIAWMSSILDLLQNIIQVLNIQPIMYHVQMKTICEVVVKACDGRFRYGKGTDADQKGAERILDWLSSMADEGIDIQNMAKDDFYLERENPFHDKYHSLEKKQTRDWSQFDIVKNGGSLEEIQNIIGQGVLSIYGRDRGGLMLTHLSSIYDRTDLLEWLVLVKGMDINSKDGQGRTALDLANSSKAASTTKWIKEFSATRTITHFMQQNYRRLRAIRVRERLMNAATCVQKSYRGYYVRKLYSGALSNRLEESQRFSAIWGHVVQSSHDLSQVASNWSSIREKVADMKQTNFEYDESYFEDTDEQLSSALETALQVGDSDITHEDSTVELLLPEENSLDAPAQDAINKSWLTFQMTSNVVKFLKQGDPKYKEFFVRRMQQLANGERSRILQKRLKGSQSTIWETYLEQKSGFRILWTEEGENIVVWFVAKHKEVSRLMKLIDDSKSRAARQQMPEALISELQRDNLLPHATQKKGVLLDLFGNVPLKLYDVSLHSIDDLTLDSWTPKLHLTDEEQDIVEAEGTVLVLGRSGTGKTCCICNRMEYDRLKYGQDPTFSQLFVARSKRLCRYVANAVSVSSSNAHSSFQTFEELTHDLMRALPSLAGNDINFLPSQRVSFQRFKQEFQSNYSSKEEKVSALTLWTVIRTFLKGSIEAFQSPDGILPKHSFVEVDILGKNRCRVPGHLREHVYDMFLRYEKYRKELKIWDDCDRARHLLLRLDESKRKETAAFDEVRRSKIYVDECQDYTQIEILLFFYLVGPSGLFLAGDPAQSVVEGTEFRFEEIRSVGYYVAGKDRRGLVPQKPRTVNVNFRSHSGILNVSGAFIEFLFQYFPGSAKQLKKDVGLFHGSRPGVLHKVNAQQLATLLSDKLKGTVVLVHDDSAHYWRQALGDYKLLYGIREAKGLEFKSVIILNFFQELPSSLHKPWRNLLLNREGLDFETKHPLVGTYLKLLYTGITRCIEKLFFVETSSSIAGDATIRWLTTSTVKKAAPQINRSESLATCNNITDIEAMSMTADEFLIEGFNNAELAESTDLDLEQAHNSLDRAIWCFQQAENTGLAAKARVHRQSVQLRLNLVPSHKQNENDNSLVEMKAAQIMESLANEGLLFEILNVFEQIRPFLSSYAEKELVQSFISKIRVTSSLPAAI